MKLLTFTSLYPNHEMPSHGVFVENRLRHLLAAGRVESRVVAPVPWFPFAHPRFGRYARYARVLRQETRNGVDVRHPRFAMLPGVGMWTSPFAMALAARGTIARMIRDGYDFDAIDAHYFYPDGVAAALLARWFKRPLVITARGSDVTQLPDYSLPRRMILDAARRADAIITVCRALKEQLVALGADGGKINVLRNGVDLSAFRPVPPLEARETLGLPASGRVIASVGHLIPRKGHDLVIEAVAALPDATLVIGGSGPERAHLERLAQRLGVTDRVRFLGQLPHQDLARVYSAADALVLSSDREGWANVLLEAMACGTPVVATDVGGSSEVVTSPEAGMLVHERSSVAIADALRRLFAAPPLREATRRYAERFSWDDTTRGQERLFEAVVKAQMHAGVQFGPELP